MSKSTRNIISSISIVFILWFIIYFLFGNFIDLEFSNHKYSKIFPKILAFLTSSSIYILFILSMNRKWNFKNFIKFSLGLILSLVPLIIFEFISTNYCTNWDVDKKNQKILYESKSSPNETIRLIQIDCPISNSKTSDILRVRNLTPLFILTSPVDSTKLLEKEWNKKIK